MICKVLERSIRRQVFSTKTRLVSFADDTRLYSGVGDVTDCDNLQLDLNAVYDWASSNNMFSYVCFSSNVSAYKSPSQISILPQR